jgi:hypothetical protein
VEIEKIPRRKKRAKTTQEPHSVLLKLIKRAHKSKKIRRRKINF